jgi:hypothetical protein
MLVGGWRSITACRGVVGGCSAACCCCLALLLLLLLLLHLLLQAAAALICHQLCHNVVQRRCRLRCYPRADAACCPALEEWRVMQDCTAALPWALLCAAAGSPAPPAGPARLDTVTSERSAALRSLAPAPARSLLRLEAEAAAAEAAAASAQNRGGLRRRPHCSFATRLAPRALRLYSVCLGRWRAV